MKKLTILFLSILFCLSCRQKTSSKLPYFNTPDFTPVWLNETSTIGSMHTIPAFAFTNQDGRTISNKDVSNSVYVADFFFTRCTSICSKMTTNMSRISNAFVNHDNVLILSHTVTPESDSVTVLKNYALRKNINNKNWHLLTGNKQSIYSIARKGYFADESMGYNKDTTEFLHTENFILVDKQGRIRGVYNGTIELEVEQLIKHIGMLEKED
jgi:protein SCO1/2